MLDLDKLKSQSKGRWVSILRALGVDIREDGKHGPCVMCGGKDRMRFDDKGGMGGYYCNHCGAGDGFALIQGVLGIDFNDAMKAVASIVGGCEKNPTLKEKRITPEQLRKMFEGGNKATCDDLTGTYLKARGLKNVPPESLWFSPKCWEAETKKEQNAMLGVFQMPDSTAVCVHRTYIDSDGNKLDIKSPKKLSPSLVKNISGGAIRLYPADGGILGVAEGIETAIAAHEDIGIPVWAAVSSTLMENFIPPENVNHVVVIADNDANFTGQKAAYVLANKLSVKHKKKVSVYVPLSPGDDWLDVFNNQKDFDGDNQRATQ